MDSQPLRDSTDSHQGQLRDSTDSHQGQLRDSTEIEDPDVLVRQDTIVSGFQEEEDEDVTLTGVLVRDNTYLEGEDEEVLMLEDDEEEEEEEELHVCPCNGRTIVHYSTFITGGRTLYD